MEYWLYGCFCLGADILASVILGIAGGIFFSARYGLGTKAKREISIFIAVFSTPLRLVIYGLVILAYGVFLKITGLGG